MKVVWLILNSLLRLPIKHFRIFIFIVLLASAFNVSGANDSTAKKLGLHLLVSLNPALQASDAIKKSDLFYSGVYYEVQYGYKKHLAGFGYVRSYKAENMYVNGIKKTKDRLHRRLNLSYTYNFYNYKKWQCFAGASFYYQQSDTMNILYTSIENQTERGLQTEQGFSAMLRGSYQFNRFFSLMLELPLYHSQHTYNYDKVYPLTPSMGTHREDSYPKTRFFIPAALYFRISIWCRLRN